MSIERLEEWHVELICDYCGETIPFNDFYEAVDYKKNKSNGWKSHKDKNGDWEDICPSCQK